MSDARLFRESVDWFIAFPEAFANFDAPTVAELDNTDLVRRITCAAAEDDTNFDLADSDTDDSLSFCQRAGDTTLTFVNAEASVTIYRSSDPTDSNQANEAFGLLAFPGITVYLIKRIGEEPGTAWATGQRIYVGKFETDYPQDVADAGDTVRLTQSLLFQGDVNWKYTLAS